MNMNIILHLDMLEKTDLIRVAQLEPEIAFLFRHALVQDAAYHSLLKQDRRQLHQVVGEVLEKTYIKNHPELAAELARHFELAGEDAAAARWYLVAGQRSMVQFANGEAAVYFTRALQLTDPDDAASRYSILALRERVNHLRGERSAQEADLAMMAEIAEKEDDPSRQAEVAVRRSEYEIAVSSYPAAILAAQKAIEAGRLAKSIELEARGYLYWGIAAWHQSEFSAAQVPLEEALHRAQAAGIADLEADCLRHLGIIADYQDRPEEAEAYLERALPIFRRTRNRRGESQALNSLGIIANSLRRFDKAEQYLQNALSIRREMGDQLGISITLTNLAVLSYNQRQYLAAEQYYRESLSICQQIQDLEGEAAALEGLGEIAARFGENKQAREMYERSIQIAHEIGDPLGEASTIIALCDVMISEGNTAEGVPLAERALEIAREIGSTSRESAALNQLGRASLIQKEAEQAILLYQQAIAITAEGPDDDAHSDARAGLAEAYLAVGRADDSQQEAAALLTDLEAAGAYNIEAFLSCFRILKAAGNPRARDALRLGYERLQEIASRIPDTTRRQIFLENVPVHQMLREAWADIQGDGEVPHAQ